MIENNLPFTEEKIGDFYIRKFSTDISSDELKWHMDAEDRIIESIYETNWKFQFDNELPISFDLEIYIKSNTYHRLLKGDGDLYLKIKKL